MLAALAICRMLHYSAAMVLFGASLYVFGVCPVRIAAALGQLTWRLVYSATVVVGISAALWLALEAGSMGEGWLDAFNLDTIKTALFDTDFGLAWQVHCLLIASLVVGVIFGWRGVVAPVSALSLASLGLIGHATMQMGVSEWLHHANLAVHLLSSGFWPGSLIPLLATLAILRRHVNDDAIVALQRFSSGGHWAVAAVLGTGFVNTALTVGTTPNVGSLYVRLLGIKILLVLFMIGLAIVNRYKLLPQLRGQPRALDALICNSAAELVLGALVVALVSLFGLLEP
jgi:putative copper resistance protein D